MACWASRPRPVADVPVEMWILLWIFNNYHIYHSFAISEAAPEARDGGCIGCHDKVHHRDWTVEKHPDTARPYLRPPWQKPSQATRPPTQAVISSQGAL